MKSIQGIVLITVCLFLQMITMLALYSIRLAWFETKISQNSWFKHILQSEGENALRNIENQVINQIPFCVISMISTEKLLAHPLTWWQTSVSCKSKIQQYNYYFVVEYLGEDPCAIVQVYPKQISADYYRITLLVSIDKINTVLQSTVITPNIDTLSICTGVEHAVTLGRQMWREMDIQKEGYVKNNLTYQRASSRYTHF